MTTTTKLDELTGDYVLDTARTRIGFAVRQTITKVRGQFDEFEGSMSLDGDDPSKSSVRLTILTSSIQTRNQRRDDHLRRSFLGTADHPSITFDSTNVVQAGRTTFKVTGDLTIRGVTKPVTLYFDLTGAEDDPEGNLRVVLEGTATINRKDWGVVWNAAAEGAGLLLGHKVFLEFEATAIHPALTDTRPWAFTSPGLSAPRVR
ncbi:YceI family protein [Kribbella sp. VKM Ac-2568]|uniref:YceI family protein n=1 Tax=Kribbella sp. VKM Ac-2568 TaxID=2512219 RepID=UPI001053A20C|nr:YceI family protein [Kribbella sp. VKM Ac-2568]TCM44560.1 polyisoprenoid-binding protein YceI [Kribbella sp. VKM Ac-2568]